MPWPTAAPATPTPTRHDARRRAETATQGGLAGGGLEGIGLAGEGLAGELLASQGLVTQLLVAGSEDGLGELGPRVGAHDADCSFWATLFNHTQVL